jgi:hypothetical protein
VKQWQDHLESPQYEALVKPKMPNEKNLLDYYALLWFENNTMASAKHLKRVIDLGITNTIEWIETLHERCHFNDNYKETLAHLISKNTSNWNQVFQLYCNNIQSYDTNVVEYLERIYQRYHECKALNTQETVQSKQLSNMHTIQASNTIQESNLESKQVSNTAQDKQVLIVHVSNTQESNTRTKQAFLQDEQKKQDTKEEELDLLQGISTLSFLNIDILKWFVSRGLQHIDSSILNKHKNIDKECISFLLEHDVVIDSQVFENALCHHAQYDFSAATCDYFIERGKITCFDRMLVAACYGRNFEAIQYFTCKNIQSYSKALDAPLNHASENLEQIVLHLLSQCNVRETLLTASKEGHYITIRNILTHYRDIANEWIAECLQVANDRSLLIKQFKRTRFDKMCTIFKMLCKMRDLDNCKAVCGECIERTAALKMAQETGFTDLYEYLK